MLIVSTAVEGFRPAKETMDLVECLPKTEGRKAILFCTHAIWKGITFKVLEKELLSEVYSTLYLFRKMKQDKPADSSDSINKIKQTLQKRTVACPNKIKLLSRCNLYKK
jgi:hypothetical protein